MDLGAGQREENKHTQQAKGLGPESSGAPLRVTDAAFLSVLVGDCRAFQGRRELVTLCGFAAATHQLLLLKGLITS